ncbi:MAG: ABC transporter substrate-binding protein, partial [Chloroflexi bacterium]|nr:ABC transporter substrate-binding protein [Chloroflexota bacterium]
MRTIRLAYRDRDRLPMIECIREMAGRHYDIEVDVLRIQPTDEYEAALFDDSCDLLIEHLEFLYASAAGGAEVTMFCAPVEGTGIELMALAAVKDVAELRGRTIAVRSSGRPEAIYMRLKAAGLDPADTVLVADADVGRWGLWKKVVSGECAAAFMSPLYMPAAEAAGLRVLAVPDLPLIGNFGHACLTRFAAENDGLMEDYLRAVVHAICLIKYRPAEAAGVEVPIRVVEPVVRVHQLPETPGSGEAQVAQGQWGAKGFIDLAIGGFGCPEAKVGELASVLAKLA